MNSFKCCSGCEVHNIAANHLFVFRSGGRGEIIHLGQRSFAHHGAHRPKMALSGAKKHHQEGLIGATRH